MAERRSAPRIPVIQAGKVTLLSEPWKEFEGMIQDISGEGMRIVLGVPVALNAAVRVDLPDSLVLGEVCYCQAEGEQYAVGLVVRHSLLRLSHLAGVRATFLQSGELGPDAPKRMTRLGR